MRIITADETGLLKVVRVETGECLAVGSGEQTRARAVKKLCHQLTSDCGKDYKTIHVARTAGVVETWELSNVEGKNITGGSSMANFKLRRTIDCNTGPVVFACVPPAPTETSGSSLLTCTEQGQVQVHSLSFQGSKDAGNQGQEATSFSIQGPISAGIAASAGGAGGAVMATGGRENDLKIWDVETMACSWKAKNVPDDFLGLRHPVWISSLEALVPAEGLRHIVTGTAHRQVRLYDTRAQKRPTHSVDAQEHGITTMAVASSGREVIVADTAGEVMALDLRKVRWGRKFRGPAGSVRGLAFHPSLPRLACVGLDRVARIYDVRSAEQKFEIYLKQRLNAVLFDEEGEVQVASSSHSKREAGEGVDGRGKDSASDVSLGSEEEYEMGNDSSDSSDDAGLGAGESEDEETDAREVRRRPASNGRVGCVDGDDRDSDEVEGADDEDSSGSGDEDGERHDFDEEAEDEDDVGEGDDHDDDDDEGEEDYAEDEGDQSEEGEGEEADKEEAPSKRRVGSSRPPGRGKKQKRG